MSSMSSLGLIEKNMELSIIVKIGRKEGGSPLCPLGFYGSDAAQAYVRNTFAKVM